VLRVVLVISSVGRSTDGVSVSGSKVTDMKCQLVGPPGMATLCEASSKFLDQPRTVDQVFGPG